MEAITLVGKVGLITGGVRRIGAAIARILHDAGMNLVLHHRSAATEAETLRGELEQRRPESIMLVQGDLLDTPGLAGLVGQAAARWNRLDLLVNNASAFFPTPVDTATEAQWDELMGSNLKAPFFLSQAAAPHLRLTQGNIVNMVDIHADRPMSKHTVYCAAKAGLVMVTKSLARELAPAVRVNGIAPGAILWPDGGVGEALQSHILSRIALRRLGEPQDIARALLFLVRDSGYITGQIIAVDGGRSLSI